MSLFFSRAIKFLRLARARKDNAILRLMYWRLGLPHDLHVGSGVRVSITDGGKVDFGRKCFVDRNSTLIVKSGCFSIGDDSYVGVGAVLCARHSIVIGKNALIAEYVCIRDQDHAIDENNTTSRNGFKTSPILIGDNVWLGAKVTITRGVTIGDNVVVGANSVVTHDIPSNVVAAGVPARVIRRIRSVERHLAGRNP